MTRILFFGSLREKAGASERTVALPTHVRDAASLVAFLAREEPALAQALAHPSVRLAVDGRMVGANAALDAPREIAFMPPFSGG